MGTIVEAIKYEYQRFKNRGFVWLVISYAQGIGYLYIALNLGRVLWPKILTLHDDRVVLWLSVAIIYNVFILTLLNLIYGLIYYMQNPFFEKYKIGPGDWPWKNKDPKKVKKWWTLYYNTMARVAFNACVITPIVQLLSLVAKGWKVPYAMEADELPDLFTFTWQLLMCLYTDDFVFSTIHRILHIPVLFRNIHSIHHRHHITVGLAATYAHPIEFIFGNVLSVTSGSLILGHRMHYWTFVAHVTWAQMNTINGHSGYEFPWSPFSMLPTQTTAEYHDYHHAHKGNYGGNFMIWDTLLGNNKDYFEHYEKKYSSIEEKRTQ